MQDYEVTDASVHDSQVYDGLLDHTQDAEGNKRAVYADSVYRSKTPKRDSPKMASPARYVRKGRALPH